VSLHFLQVTYLSTSSTFRHLLPIETLPTLSPFACHYESKTALHHTSPTNSRVRPSSSSEIYIDKAGFSKLGFFFHGSPSGGLCFIFPLSFKYLSANCTTFVSYMPKFIETDNLTSTSILIVLLQLMILSLARNWSGEINSIRRLLSHWHK
jgi:hypothetical protein